jgi:hypothetical protein
MPPVSQERLEWIEERLFIIARSLGVLRRDGVRIAVRSLTESGAEAQALSLNAMQQLNIERLSLLAERQAINDYMQEKNGN